MKIEGILESCLYGSDLDAMLVFYRDVLGLELHSQQEGRHVFFRCGSQMLLIFKPQVTSNKNSALPTHGTSGAGHLAFSIAENEYGNWKTSLQSKDIKVEQEVKWPSSGLSIYFRDPAGNSIELATSKTWNT